jgi:hypothetical protein
MIYKTIKSKYGGYGSYTIVCKTKDRKDNILLTTDMRPSIRIRNEVVMMLLENNDWVAHNKYVNDMDNII